MKIRIYICYWTIPFRSIYICYWTIPLLEIRETQYTNSSGYISNLGLLITNWHHIPNQLQFVSISQNQHEDVSGESGCIIPPPGSVCSSLWACEWKKSMYRTAKEGSPDNLNIKKDKNRNPPPPPPERGSYADFTLACDLSFERSIFSPMLSRGRVHHPPLYCWFLRSVSQIKRRRQAAR